MIHVKCVVLAAGFGSRMQPFSSFRPKFMLPVAGKPIIQYGVETIRDQLGVTEFIFVVGYLRNTVIDYFNSGKDLGVNIKYVVQHTHQKRGLAAAIKLVEDHISSDFIVYLADNLYEADFRPLIDSHFSEGSDVTLLTELHDNPSRFGVVVSDENGNVSQVIEKPENPPSNQVITGFYIFTPAIFNAIDKVASSKTGEYDITSAIQHIIEQKGKVKSMTLDGWRQDMGFPKDLLTVNNTFLDKNSNGENIQEEFKDTKIIPPVYISPNCIIENSTIGPFVMLEKGVTVIGSHVSNSVVLDLTKIINSKITNSVIGAKCLIKDSLDNHLLIGDFSELYGKSE